MEPDKILFFGITLKDAVLMLVPLGIGIMAPRLARVAKCGASKLARLLGRRWEYFMSLLLLAIAGYICGRYISDTRPATTFAIFAVFVGLSVYAAAIFLMVSAIRKQRGESQGQELQKKHKQNSDE
ncbi:hypothetical protein [Bordetella genomosp. 4]|uniref:Uncharacterized protein n=1 Tax=Bordetella genomosp. 4 TaxID=463044 RepID=A0A261UTL0_9BORD|nr:hypothetical protein [Bordetella genomosp. 4]OZI64600.1 hypothetical protein CAL20_02800 [Bordetella genomosp. 4]